ncbi:MAG TPA: hypothetical protein VHP33_07435 [Polyangiaceae bacterium]|nr:hypothetical protein [Polyangiaceae bacterium]
MTELPRLLDHGDDDFERALLGAGRSELPRPAALRDAALAIGIVSSTADALAASVPVTHGATAATGGAATSVAASATVAALGKGVLGGALVTLLGLTAVDHFVAAEPPQRVAVPISARAAGADDATQATTVLAAPAPVLTVDPLAAPPEAAAAPLHGARRPSFPPESPLPAPAPEPRRTAPANAAFAPLDQPRPSSPAVVANPSLAAEIRLLDRARAALAAGDRASARQALDTYAANRPSPTLAHEAALLRKALGDLDHAR